MYQNVEKHHFSANSTRLLTPEAKIEKTARILLNSDNFPDSHQISKLSDISFTFLISLKKKLRDAFLTAVNQMVDGSGTELSNEIARSRMDISNVLMRNVYSHQFSLIKPPKCKKSLTPPLKSASYLRRWNLQKTLTEFEPCMFGFWIFLAI